MAKKKASPGPGRPSKLTAAVQQRICKLIREGNYRCVAAAAAGVASATLIHWMARGKKEKEGEFFDFRRAVMEAEQDAEIKMVAQVIKAAKKDARHAEWWLERKRHQRWGKKDTKRHEHTGRRGGPIEGRMSFDIPDNGRGKKEDQS